MKNVLTLVTLLNFLTACGTIDTVNVDGAGAEEEAKNKESGTTEVEVETTTTTSTKVRVGQAGGEMVETGGRRLVAEYELKNSNRANTQFIGANYCAGSNLRDCWIRSGLMSEYSDGTYEVSIELWDTYEANPYSIESGTIDAEHAFLLTDKAKSVDDETVPYKMLWAVVIPEDKTMGVFYDWGNDGPNDQGDDMLDAFQFQKIDESDD